MSVLPHLHLPSDLGLLPLLLVLRIDSQRLLSDDLGLLISAQPRTLSNVSDNAQSRRSTHLLDGELLVGLDLDLSGLLARLLRDESDLVSALMDRTGSAVCWDQGGRTILFISDWISLSDNAPRDMMGDWELCLYVCV